MAQKINIDLVANLARFTGSIDKATTQLNRFQSNTKRISRGIGNAFRGLSLILPTVGFGALVKGSLEAADQIQKLSIRLGASTEALSQYKYVADLTGVSFRTLTLGFQRMTRRISEAANGMGEARGAIRELGLDALELNKLQPDKQFEVLADAIIKVKSPADQVRLAMKLFDSEGVALIQSMKGGSEAIKAMREEAEKLGITLDQDTADAAADANDAMTRLSSSGQRLGIALVASLGPAIESVANWLSKNIPAAVNSATEAFYRLQEVALGIGSVVTGALGGLAGGLAKLADFAGFEKLESALERTAEGYNNVSETARKAALRSIQTRLDPPKADDKKWQQAGFDLGQLFAQGVDEGTKKGKTDEEKAFEALQKYTDALKDTLDPARKVFRELNQIELAFKEGLLTADEYDDALFKVMGTLQDLGQISSAVGEKTEVLSDKWQELGPQFASAFEDAVVDGRNLSDVLKGLEKDIIRLATRIAVTEPLTNFFSGVISIGSGKVAEIFTRATGGPVSANSPYIVGEQGPELFVPNSNGTIIPNNEIMSAPGGLAMGGVTVNVVNNAPGVQAVANERNEGGVRVIDVMVERVKTAIAGDIATGNGPVPAALTGTYGLSRVSGAY